MASRPFGPFIESPGDYGRRPRMLWFWMMILLAVVVAYVAFRNIPGGPVEILSDRQATRILKEAEQMENQSLNLSAAEQYNRVVGNERVGAVLRVRAARGLARVYREMPGHTEAVEAALEKAYRFSPVGPERDAVRDELETLRGRPLSAVAGDTRTTATQPAPADTNPYPVPTDAHILARLGSETVSLEEILYAFGQFNGMRKPTAQELRPFVKMYLDMSLLADHARHDGLDHQPATVYDLRVRRIMSLNQAVNERLVKELKTPDLKMLEAFYNANKVLFTVPARAIIGHIVVKDADDAAKVRKALDQGQKFDKVAKQYSLDAEKLKDGYLLGMITQNDPGIPEFGPNPALIGRLLALDSGATTGPIASQRGQHWVRIVEKSPAVLRPFKDVQDDALLKYQQAQLTQARLNLLARLHSERKIEIKDPSFSKDMTEPASPAPATPPAAASEDETTGTQAAAATPAPTPALTPTPIPTPTPKPTAKAQKNTTRKRSSRRSGDDNASEQKSSDHSAEENSAQFQE